MGYQGPAIWALMHSLFTSFKFTNPRFTNLKHPSSIRRLLYEHYSIGDCTALHPVSPTDFIIKGSIHTSNRNWVRKRACLFTRIISA